MKQLLTLMLALACSVGMSAQLLDVAGVHRVQTGDLSVDRAVISPDGAFAVVSNNADVSLARVDLADGSMVRLTENGNIHGLMISEDSRNMVFRCNTVDAHHRRYTSVEVMDLATRQQRQVLEPSRRFDGMRLVGNTVLAVNDRRLHTHRLAGRNTAKAPVATIHLGQLMLTRADGTTVALNPQGKEGQSYLWPSVSPDGRRVAYYLSGDGCYVCNVDGTDVVRVGDLRGARWYGNDMLVGMRDRDNGYVFTESAIVARTLDGREQVLTSPEVIAMYPSINGDGSRIAFTTPAGDLYTIDIKR